MMMSEPRSPYHEHSSLTSIEEPSLQPIQTSSSSLNLQVQSDKDGSYKPSSLVQQICAEVPATLQRLAKVMRDRDETVQMKMEEFKRINAEHIAKLENAVFQTKQEVQQAACTVFGTFGRHESSVQASNTPLDISNASKKTKENVNIAQTSAATTGDAATASDNIQETANSIKSEKNESRLSEEANKDSKIHCETDTVASPTRPLSRYPDWASVDSVESNLKQMEDEIMSVSRQKIGLAEQMYQLVAVYINAIDRTLEKVEQRIRKNTHVDIGSGPVNRRRAPAKRIVDPEIRALQYTIIHEFRGDIDRPVTSVEKLWCVCQQPSFGTMVACENEKCPIEWYHLQCVGLEVAPIGKWYCDKCKPFIAQNKKRKRW